MAGVKGVAVTGARTLVAKVVAGMAAEVMAATARVVTVVKVVLPARARGATMTAPIEVSVVSAMTGVIATVSAKIAGIVSATGKTGAFAAPTATRAVDVAAVIEPHAGFGRRFYWR